MLTVWGRADSANVQIVMWAAAELGLEVRRHDVGHRFGGNDRADFLAMNPNGLVPVLCDGDDPPLWESGAILRYLANRYGAPPFWPEGAAARAQIDKWAEWAKVTVFPAFIPAIFWPHLRAEVEPVDPTKIRGALAALGRLLGMAEAELGRHPFLAGEALTPADIAFGVLLYRYHTLPIERPDLPALRGYYDRLCERPAYAEHVMVPYDALRVRA